MFAFTVFTLAGAFAGGLPAPANAADCRGTETLGGDFQLEGNRRITLSGVACDQGRRVVKRFPARCAGAYAGQGSCRIQSSGRWRCLSTMVGPLSKGAPARVKCRKGRGRITFTVAYFPPTDGVAPAPAASAASGPYDDAKHCFNAAPVGTGEVYEVQRTPDVPSSDTDIVKSQLDKHQVALTLNSGLLSRPRGHPPRPFPIVLAPDKFESSNARGLTAPTCSDARVDAAAVRMNDIFPEDGATTAAHELFHAHSNGLNNRFTPDNWFEEAGATWSEAKSGFPENDKYDYALQYPGERLDTPPFGRNPTYPYAMSRFVQLLEDKGLVTAGGSWPLVRAVVGNPDTPTDQLARELATRGTNLQDQLAAFWGDRLKEHPAHGKQLNPGPENSITRRIHAGDSEMTVSADPLTTRLVNFGVEGDVDRVEFEFEPPEDKQFWGLVEPNYPQEFKRDSSMAFCVTAHADEQDWPGHFPVTLTNANLTGGKVSGKVKIHAQEGTDKPCTSNHDYPCKVMTAAAKQVLRGGFQEFPSRKVFFPGLPPGTCLLFGADPGDPGYAYYAFLNIRRHSSAKAARASIDSCIKKKQCERIRVGNRAGITRLSFTHKDVDTGQDLPDLSFNIYTANGRLELSVYLNLITRPETPELEERETTIKLARAVLKNL